MSVPPLRSPEIDRLGPHRKRPPNEAFERERGVRARMCAVPARINDHKTTRALVALEEVSRLMRPRASSRRHDHLDAAVFLVTEGLVHLRTVLERNPMGDHEGWIDLPLLDALE